MVARLHSLCEIAPQFDVIVLDQWGVLHDGSAPYSGAIQALSDLRQIGTRLAVLSNSGKRSALNLARIVGMGFEQDFFELVMTSGEALWLDIRSGAVTERVFCPIEAAAGDAQRWAEALDIAFTDDPDAADAIVLMGLPDQGSMAAPLLMARALARGLPVYCTNPDRASPRAGGATVISPGTLAHDFAARGGHVRFYGKPHGPVFDAVAKALNVAPRRVLMVGDSFEHDIAGGAAAGWATAFVESGLHADAFAAGLDPVQSLLGLCRIHDSPLPDFVLPTLR